MSYEGLCEGRRPRIESTMAVLRLRECGVGVESIELGSTVVLNRMRSVQ